MKKLFRVLCLFAAITIVACQGDDSYSPAPAPNPQLTSPSPSPSCFDVIYDMADCITFLADGETDDKPTASCCSGFKTVLNVDDECICEAIKSSSQLGIKLNMTRATMLPSACGVDSFSISSCGIEPPTPAPMAPTPNPSPSTPSTPTPNPSPPAPSTPTTEPPSPSSSSTSPVEAPTSGSHSISASIFIVSIIFGLYASLVN